ncbi:MAG: hypothetical protein J1F28_06990 [Oscillospiraceae bacterium]|nr:hypothetical protein [Oscillospiraceae bacterium]
MRRRRKRDIIIELTSLLDVIMIIIFMVMTENSRLITEKQSALDAVQLENEALSDRLDGLEAELDEALGKLGEGSLEELINRLAEAESRLESYEYMDDVVFVINVGLENRYNNTVRYLSFGKTDSDQNLYEIRNDDDLSTAINRLKIFITEYIAKISDDESNSTIVYVVFSYDTHNVYQDDYAAIDEALKSAEIRANSGNFRYHCNPL